MKVCACMCEYILLRVSKAWRCGVDGVVDMHNGQAQLFFAAIFLSDVLDSIV